MTTRDDPRHHGDRADEADEPPERMAESPDWLPDRPEWAEWAGSPEAPLSKAKARRRDLLQAMRRFEQAIQRPSGQPDWLSAVDSALEDLEAALEAHTREVEEPGGLLEEMLETAPRLSSQVRTIREEHVVLAESIQRARHSLRTEQSDVVSIRRKATTLLGRLARHRQRGSDLVYDAYNVDIAAGD